MKTVPAPPSVGARTLIYAAAGLVLGLCLTLGGYLVDYYALYDELPSSWSLATLKGLHDITPVHYFADLFALVLAAVGALAGWLQDRVIFYSSELEKLVDIRTSHLREREAELRYLAFHDPLTDLPNRTLLMDRLPRVLERMARYESRLALIYVGIDRFTKVSESLGHAVADRLLRRVSQRIGDTLREFEREEAHNTAETVAPGASLFSLDGDEFAIVLEDIRSLRVATRAATRMEKAFAVPFSLDDRDVMLSLSAGIVVAQNLEQGCEKLLRDAKTAMRRAKRQGRARYSVFDRQMVADVEEALHLETELFQALQDDHLELHYQPIVALGSDTLQGFEALARWEHPRHGRIAPGRFIPLAEETGQIVDMSRRLFRRALERLADWKARFPERPDFTLNMNLSPNYLFHPKLATDLGVLFRDAQTDLSCLHLEITESSFIDRPEKVATVLERLKKWGVKIAIDDFGTGFSSLSMLHALPVDILKIDRRFVSRLEEDPDAKRIVETIIGLADKLGMEVVAEGIETQGQLRVLKGLRCPYGQGFLLGEPLEPAAAEESLQAAASRPRGRRRASRQ